MTNYQLFGKMILMSCPFGGQLVLKEDLVPMANPESQLLTQGPLFIGGTQVLALFLENAVCWCLARDQGAR